MELFCLLIFILSVTEISLCEVNAHFPSCFVPIILAHHIKLNAWGNYWRESSRKCALTSQSGIAVMDRIKINEQNKSIVTGPLYEQAEFEGI